MRTLFFSSLLLVLSAIPATAQTAEQVVKWSAKIPAQGILRPGQKATVSLSAEIENGWHVYAISQVPGGPTAMTVTVPRNQPFTLGGKITSSTPEHKFDPNFGIDTAYHMHSLSVTIPLLVAHNTPAGSTEAKIDVRFQACTDSMCLPPTTTHLVIPLVIRGPNPKHNTQSKQSGETDLLDVQLGWNTLHYRPLRFDLQQTYQVPTVALQAGFAVPDGLGSQEGGKSLWSFLWLAAGMGALSLLTPCVFPMIPITISYFTKHYATSGRNAFFSASTYAIGIISTFTAFGMLLAIVFGAGGINRFAANPWVNLLIAAIFIGFALSLFGVYFIQVPSSVLTRVDALTRSKEGSRTVGALLMGFTFTLTSFTCTAPFVGTLLVMASQGNWHWPLLGMLAFSFAFSIPFFVLALMPQLLSQLPRAGSWMNTVKVVMGYLEIAAAMKFLSNADLVWRWGIFNHKTVLVVWILIGMVIAAHLVGRLAMPSEAVPEKVSFVRATLALLFVATSVWLSTGLFGRSLGELESFLPPSASPVIPQATSSNTTQLDWILNDYGGALRQARLLNKPLFIDFTGYTCTNCRWMEANMFTRPEVHSALQKFVLARLYTDGDGAVFDSQQKMERERFGTVALPFYAIISASDQALATFPGLTRNPNEFQKFLSTDRAATTSQN